MRICVYSPARDSGKSTLAVNLACELSDVNVLARDRWEGAQSVVLVDSTDNGSATRHWSGGRLTVSGQNLPLERGNVEEWIQLILSIQVDYVVVDGPPSVDAAIESAMVIVSDAIVIPCPASVDRDALASTIAVIREVRLSRSDRGPHCLLVPVGIGEGAEARKHAEIALAKFKEPVGPPIRQRTDFADAFKEGRWIGDFAPGSPAHADIKALAASVARLPKSNRLTAKYRDGTQLG